MKTYKQNTYAVTRLLVNNSKEGESIETKVERILNNKEPIKDGAPIIFTPRKEGVRASTNIRTDRWEVALEATDKIAKSYKARREERIEAEKTGKKGESDGGPDSIQGKGTKDSTGIPM